MRGNERASLICSRELTGIIKQEIVRRPMGGKHRDWCALGSTQPDGFPAVPTVFRGKTKLALSEIEITIWPTVVRALLKLHQLLRGFVRALLRSVEALPVFPQLVTAVHGRKYPSCGVEYDSFPIAQTGGETLGGREPLPSPIRVVAPDAGPRLELSARLNTRRIRHSVSDLAGICGRAEVHIECTLDIDLERVHRVIAGKRQSRDDHLGRIMWCNSLRRQRITNDAVVCFRVKRAIIERDSSATGIPAFSAGTETDDHISPAVAGRIFQGNQESAGGRFVVAVIAATPAVDIEHAVGGHDHLPSVTDVVGEHRCTKAGGQGDRAVVARAGPCSRDRAVRVLGN